MASEIEFSYQSLRNTYCLIRNRIGQIWNTSGATGAFENYQTSMYLLYNIAATEQGTASAFYTANMPTAVPAGVYNIVAKNRAASSGAETDATVAVGDLQWNGTVTLPLSDLATSGQIGQISPIRVARGVMVQNFPVYMKSSTDHVTPLTSGVVSGQIARDGGSFGPLQSGAFTEIGYGYYNLQALTSGDLAGNTIKLLFTAAGISGGLSDPLPLSFICQRVSGY